MKVLIFFKKISNNYDILWTKKSRSSNPYNWLINDNMDCFRKLEL